MSTLGKVFIYFIRFFRVVLGLALIATFLWALNDQKFTDENWGKAHAVLQQAAAEGIPTISSENVNFAYEEQFVHTQGELAIGDVYDPLTGLTLKAIGMWRHIEMLQWEQESYRMERQLDDKWRARWHKVWSDEIIDSDSFRKTDEYFAENRDNPEEFPHDKDLPLDTSHLAIGGWPLEITFADRLVTSEVIPPDMLKSAELADGWYASGDGRYLLPPQNATSMASDAIGAIRVRYTYTPLAEGAYSAVGIVRDGKLVDHIYERVYSLPLMAPGDVSADELAAQTLAVLADGRAPQKNWIGYVFVGLLLCIGVLARLFPFFKGFTEAPFPKRALITVVVAAIGTAVTGALV